MSEHRFFIPPERLPGAASPAVGARVELPGDVSYQLRTVLRARPGARVLLLDGVGSEYLAELEDLHGDRARARILDRRPAAGEPAVFVTVYAALLKSQHLEWVLQKGAELGVSAFVPMVTRRTVVRDVGRVLKKRARWERILREAAEQCRRARIPHLSDPLPFADACHAAASGHECVFMPCVGRGIGLGQAVREAGARAGRSRLALLIGPEGGYDEDEVQFAVESGVQAVSLGPRTLRAETAALAAAAILLDQCGELGSERQ